MTKPLHGERTLHGVRIAVPEDWQDWSLFRFAPALPEDRLPSTTKVKRLAASLTVSRIVAKETGLEAHFARLNRELAESTPGMKVTAGGALEYLGQRAVWQDIALSHQGAPLQQRHLLFPGPADPDAPDSVVLLTMTGDREQVLALSKAIGLELPR